jgi:DHA2 family multidrug resistance protein-like MFS transporter
LTRTVGHPRAGRREWVGLGVIALPCLLYAMDLTVLNLALPQLSAELRPTSSQLLWIVDIYGFLAAGSLVTMGTLGDRIGRRRLLLIGAAAFGAASVLAAFSASAGLLIAARALLGVAGATLAPSTLSLIRAMFADPRQRALAVGVWISSFSAGAAVGPVLGGLLLEAFWWGSVFLIAVPVMAVLLALGPVLLPEFRDPDAGRLDLPSAALSLATVLAVIYGLKQLAQGGPGWVPGVSMLAGLVLGIVFIRRQRTAADPLLDLSLFRNHAFSTALATNTLDFFVSFGAMLFIAQYLQLVLGLSPLEAGLWMVPSAVGLIVGSMLAPVLVRWARPWSVMAAGLVAGAFGFGLLTLVDDSSGLPLVVAGSVVFSVGFAPLTTLATDLMIGAAPPERAGAASAVSETTSEFGGAMGIAVLGSIGTVVYRTQLAGTVPAGVPPAAAEAARDTLGGALAAAQALPAPLGAALQEAAREAFTQGLRLAFAVNAGLAVGIAVLVAVLLRGVRPGDEPADDRPTRRRRGARRRGRAG